MFGMKIRSWMEAQIARSRAKRKERKGASSNSSNAHQESDARTFETKLFGARPDFNEVLPTLPFSSSSFKPKHPTHHIHQQKHQHHQQQHHSQQQHQQQQQHFKSEDQQYAPAGSTVNLSSPESAYSTGYSTDGTSPCATYAPEHYANVRESSTGKRRPEVKGDVIWAANNSHITQISDKIDTTGTYSVSRARHPQPPDFEQQHQWRKPPPPTTSRPPASSPKIQTGQLLGKPYASPVADVLQHHLSPQRTTLSTPSTAQMLPIKSPRQRSRIRTNPSKSSRSSSAMVMSAVPRPWSRQQQHQDLPHFGHYYQQQSLSIERGSVTRADWRNGTQIRQQQHQQQLRSRTRSNSASSYSSSRSRSCSISSTGSSSDSSNSDSNSNSSNSRANISSRGSDDNTLNEVLGQFDENYPYDKETDIVSDHSGGDRCCDNSSSANFSSDMSGSSLDMQLDTRSRSASRYQSQPRELSRNKHRQRKYKRCVQPQEDEEVELLHEVLRRRLKNNNNEATAQSNRALLERLLMKNAHTGFESRRAWSVNPGPLRPSSSRSVGGTPICLRRRISHPRNKLIFDRNHQIYPAESNSFLKNTSASELALLEADREADLKYAQLIMEAEQMLLNARQQLEMNESPQNSPSPCHPHGLYRKQGTVPNRQVELIKNAEINTELLFSKSRNSQPELSSGSIKDLLDHSSPKRLLQKYQKKNVYPVVPPAIPPRRSAGNNFPTFKSYDVKPTMMLLSNPQDHDSGSASGYSCPQSEPVKRKVYEGQEVGRMLQQHVAPWLRNSDGDCATEQQQQQQSQLYSTSARSSYSQLKKHMLIETLQDLKQSLEDQSAALKMNCLRPL